LFLCEIKDSFLFALYVRTFNLGRTMKKGAEVHVKLPKFDIENKYNLNDALNAMGVERAFQNGVAQFDHMFAPQELRRPPLCIRHWGIHFRHHPLRGRILWGIIVPWLCHRPLPAGRAIGCLFPPGTRTSWPLIKVVFPWYQARLPKKKGRCLMHHSCQAGSFSRSNSRARDLVNCAMANSCLFASRSSGLT